MSWQLTAYLIKYMIYDDGYKMWILSVKFTEGTGFNKSKESF
jgi:hypothetical protein